MQDKEPTVLRVPVPVAMKVPGIFKATLYAIIAVGVVYSWGNLLSLGGYVLAAILLTLYIMIEGTAVDYFNKYTTLRTIIEIKMLEVDGTITAEDCLTISEEEDDAKTSTD